MLKSDRGPFLTQIWNDVFNDRFAVELIEVPGWTRADGGRGIHLSLNVVATQAGIIGNGIL